MYVYAAEGSKLQTCIIVICLHFHHLGIVYECNIPAFLYFSPFQQARNPGQSFKWDYKDR